MKKKHKILLGMLVLAGCLLFGCEKRRTELFSEEKQDTEEAGATSVSYTHLTLPTKA